MRGEYRIGRLVAREKLGSPPHAWGIRRMFLIPLPGLRFTPTCVGNTSLPRGGSVPSPVHPHMRGEYDAVIEIEDELGGSPPHAWGIHQIPYLF